jgi:hypothetical protein
MVSSNEFTSTFKNAGVLLVNTRLYSSAYSFSGLENGDFQSMSRKPPGRSQTGETRADYDHGCFGHSRRDFFPRKQLKRVNFRNLLYLL